MLEEPPIVTNRRSTPVAKQSDHEFYSAACFVFGWMSAVAAIPIAVIFGSGTMVCLVTFGFFVLGYLGRICAHLDNR